MMFTLVAAISCGKDEPDPNQPVKIPSVNAVDLGLSVKWADANVGAENESGFGLYFAWGETSVKENYSWESYKLCGGSSTSMTKYCTTAEYGKKDDLSVLQPEDDIAHVAFGGKWRIPTEEEWKELKENCTWTKKLKDGEFIGYIVSSKVNENSIFLPAAGGWENASAHRTGTTGFYWTADLYEKSCYANVFFFNNGGLANTYGSRSFGLPVRAVTE